MARLMRRAGRMRSVLRVATLLAFLVATPLAAQRDPAQRAASQARFDSLRVRARSDSAARMRVLEFMWERLAPHLLRAAMDTATQAWVFRLPAEDPLTPQVEAHLRTALRAREPLPADTAVFVLTLTPAVVAADTTRATLTLDYEHRCAPGARAGGWGTVYPLFAPRIGAGGPWGPARAPRIVEGARALCRPPAR